MILSKKTMMTMMIVKVAFVFSLSIGLVFSSSSVISTEYNNDIDENRHEQTVIDVVDRRGVKGDVDIDDAILMNDVMMMMKPHESSSSSLLHQRMMMKEHQIMKSKNHLIYGNMNISTEQQKHNNEQRLLQLEEIMKQNDQDDLELLSFHQRMTTITSQGCITDQIELEAAIMIVPDNALTPSTINICKEYIFIDASTIDAGTEGGIHIVNKFLNIRCTINGRKKCIIDAQGLSRHFYVETSSLVLNRVSLINGYDITNGGSLYISSSSNIIMNNVDLIGNKADNAGGAIFCYYNNNMKLLNVNMINNSARDNDGGAIWSTSNIEMTNVLLMDNTASSSQGGYQQGGAFYTYGCNADMMNVSFINNTAWRGGAYVSYYGRMTLVDSTMTNNKATEGGAIFFNNQFATITNSLFNSNSAGYVGGAIMSTFGTILFSDVVITNNSAPSGILTLANSEIDLKRVLLSCSILDVDNCYQDILVLGWTDFSSLRVYLPSSPPPLIFEEKRNTTQACVTTYTALRNQVRLCSNPCVINICTSRIQMKNIVGISQSIDLSNKNIVFNCQQNNLKRCMIDGRGVSKMFFGSNVHVTFQNIIFANGYSSDTDGVIDIRSGSFLNLISCTFVKNSAASGGVVKVVDTVFYMTGTQSSFINNNGNIPPLVGLSSNLNVYGTTFEGNAMTEYGNGILVLGSTIELYNNIFSESKNAMDLVCNVFLAGHLNDFSQTPSCLGMGSVN